MFKGVLNTPQPTHRNLVFLSPNFNDSEDRIELKDYLNDEKMTFSVIHAKGLHIIHEFDLDTVGEAVIIDMRAGRKAAKEAIIYIEELELEIPIIGLFESSDDLQRCDDFLHLIDDTMLTDHLPAGELPTRIDQAIRRRKRYSELLDEKTLLESLFDNIPDTVYFKDRESRFIKVNPPMTRIADLVSGDLIGKSDFDLFPNDRDHAQQAYKDEQQIIHTEMPVVNKLEKEVWADGTIKWMDTTKMPSRDHWGRVVGTMGISRDVTKLKNTQDMLDAERSKLEAIIEHALAGIFVKDIEGRYLTINSSHTRYLGAESASDVVGKTIFDFMETAEAEKITAADQKILKTATPVENMVDYRQRKDGSELWLLTSKVPLKDDSGKVTALIGISLDITEQKKNERTLKNTIEILEQTKLQLIEAEKFKSVGRLASGIAHEIKNPLSVVSLGAEYLNKKFEGSSELLDVVKDMRQAVNKANEVISELLDYSSPHELSMDPCNLNRLIKRVLDLMRHNIREADIKIETDFADELTDIRLDASKIEQVFFNTILNSISAMPNGGTLKLRTSRIRMTDTGANVSGPMTELFRVGDSIALVEIIDSGVGLSKEDAQKAFEPFYSQRSTGEGTGLGLSVSKSIIDLHHGRISLENRDDAKGAHTRIYLPEPSIGEKNDSSK